MCQNFNCAGGVSGAHSSRNEPSTADCRCHQCTRRAHSLLKDDDDVISEIIIWIGHTAHRNKGTSKLQLLLYLVTKWLILSQDPKTN